MYKYVTGCYKEEKTAILVSRTTECRIRSNWINFQQRRLEVDIPKVSYDVYRYGMNTQDNQSRYGILSLESLKNRIEQCVSRILDLTSKHRNGLQVYITIIKWLTIDSNQHFLRKTKIRNAKPEQNRLNSGLPVCLFISQLKSVI